MLDSGTEGARVQIADVALSGNSLRQIVHTHRASVYRAAKLVAALLRVARVTAGRAESNGFMTHVNCRLTGKNRDQLRNPTLGNRVWATFTILAAVLEGTWLLPAYWSLVTVAVVYETRSTVVERRSLTGELSLSYARPAADG